MVEFGTGDKEELYGSQVEMHKRQLVSATTEEGSSIAVASVVRNLEAVCGAANFSLALRNSEHLARLKSQSWELEVFLIFSIMKNDFLHFLSS